MRSKLEIPTPALLLDLDAFETNLALMADCVKRSGKSLRPHAKAHKCVEIARRQVAAGAIGVCVATVPEAELISSAGIGGLLLTSPLADPLKMARAVATGASGWGLIYVNSTCYSETVTIVPYLPGGLITLNAFPFPGYGFVGFEYGGNP